MIGLREERCGHLGRFLSLGLFSRTTFAKNQLDAARTLRKRFRAESIGGRGEGPNATISGLFVRGGEGRQYHGDEIFWLKRPGALAGAGGGETTRARSRWPAFEFGYVLVLPDNKGRDSELPS